MTLSSNIQRTSATTAHTLSQRQEHMPLPAFGATSFLCIKAAARRMFTAAALRTAQKLTAGRPRTLGNFGDPLEMLTSALLYTIIHSCREKAEWTHPVLFIMSSSEELNAPLSSKIQRTMKILSPVSPSFSSETSKSCYAWALMKNHVHLLLRSGCVPLASFMRRLLTGYDQQEVGLPFRI